MRPLDAMIQIPLYVQYMHYCHAKGVTVDIASFWQTLPFYFDSGYFTKANVIIIQWHPVKRYPFIYKNPRKIPVKKGSRGVRPGTQLEMSALNREDRRS